MDIGLGAAAFWIALAAVLIAGGWHKLRREQLKQETLLRLIERTGTLDEAQVKALFPPPPATPWPPAWHLKSDPNEGKLVLRGFGVVITFIAVGVAVLFTVMLNFGTPPQQAAAVPGLGAAGLVACIGLGFLVASKFATSSALRDERD